MPISLLHTISRTKNPPTLSLRFLKRCVFSGLNFTKLIIPHSHLIHTSKFQHMFLQQKTSYWENIYSHIYGFWCLTRQWRTQEFYSGGGGVKKLSLGQRERGSGGSGPLVRGSGGSCNLVQEISFHIVKFTKIMELCQNFGIGGRVLNPPNPPLGTPLLQGR
jgi:hypothetical protein